MKKNCRTLILGTLQLNCHIFGEVWLHIFVIIALMTMERKRRVLCLRSLSTLATCFPTWNQSGLIPFMPVETNCDNTRGKESLFIKTQCWKLEQVGFTSDSIIYPWGDLWQIRKWAFSSTSQLFCPKIKNYRSHLELSLVMFELSARTSFSVVPPHPAGNRYT